MRVLIFFSLLCYCFYACSEAKPKQTIHFEPLTTSEFNFSADSSFAIPKGNVWDERKRMHDSCMGESFPANAIFIKTQDAFFLGCIVNRKTLQRVKNLDIRNPLLFGSAFNFITKPCYEKHQLGISPAAFIHDKIALNINIDGADAAINKEVTNTLYDAVYTEIESGSWINMEFTGALGKILDTTTNDQLLEYRKYLLDTTNMVLIRSSSITDISFYITTPKPMSKQLQQILSQKPFANISNSNFKTQLFFISSNSLQVKFSGIFQIMGQFMQCKLE
ncbi:hypothetical protein FRZ67_02225 [Panacibacter ginsenosidivorans]|uniref:Uncharacterized protein n=1 Tax=Panacibacter ginsenosidivorans TaxID=1813871 RepID=A0A5B8V4S0_9BACT|nr:hypothetical protein [Panacibacter ginsenosidivorans]QEC66178.1 hypothetical protein FRZ67_02225 [Panacibacter ginsenosidivorans]